MPKSISARTGLANRLDRNLLLIGIVKCISTSSRWSLILHGHRSLPSQAKRAVWPGQNVCSGTTQAREALRVWLSSAVLSPWKDT